VGGYAPRAQEDSVRPRRLVGGPGRPLNFTVRSHLGLRFVRDFWRRFGTWWHAPTTRRDRMIGAVSGALGGFWIGCLCRLIIGPLPISLTVVLSWGLGAAFVTAILGVAFPKVVTCVCVPFATLPGLFGGS
jgi:hypothetical protein